jgi:hypothetical protein
VAARGPALASIFATRKSARWTLGAMRELVLCHPAVCGATTTEGIGRRSAVRPAPGQLVTSWRNTGLRNRVGCAPCRFGRIVTIMVEK